MEEGGALVKFNFSKAGSWQKARAGGQSSAVQIRGSIEAHWSIGLRAGGVRLGGTGRGVKEWQTQKKKHLSQLNSVSQSASEHPQAFNNN